jgi:hypothetical protein
MIENVMHRIGGVNAFGIFTICLFFAFFIGMIVYAARLKKPFVISMSEMPLDDGAAPRTKPTSDGESQ